MTSAANVPDRMVVDDPEQLAVLASPVRLELVEHFALWGPSSIADIARRMERPPDSLYYHVRKLVSVGLLELVRNRRKGTRFEAIYRLPAGKLQIARCPTSEARDLWCKTIHALLRLAGRELDDVLEGGAAGEEGPSRSLDARRLRGRLSTEAVAEVNRHLAIVEQIYAREAVSHERSAHPVVSLTWLMTPDERGPDE